MASAKKILDYERELKAAGITDKQAEIHAQKLADIIESTLVTKNHFDHRLKEHESQIDKKLVESSHEIRKDLVELKHEVTTRLVEIESSIYKFLITVMMAMMAVSGAMQTIFHYWK